MMKRILLIILLLPLLACSNVLKEEELLQVGNYYYEDEDTLANGISKVEIEGKSGKKFYNNGTLTKLTLENIEYHYRDGLLNGEVNLGQGRRLTFKDGLLVKAKDSNKKISFNHGIPEGFLFDLGHIPIIKEDFFKVYRSGLVTETLFKSNRYKVIETYSPFGTVASKKIYVSKDKLYNFTYITSGEKLGYLKSFEVVTKGLKQGSYYTYNESNYTVGSYKDNEYYYSNTYNFENKLFYSYDFSQKNRITYYEYYHDFDAIKLIGYVDEDMNSIGRWTYFYPSGNTKEYREFLNEDIAYFNSYYENGMKESSGTINTASNIYLGPLKRYYMNGLVKSIEEYDDNGLLLDGAKYFDEKGVEVVFNNKDNLY